MNNMNKILINNVFYNIHPKFTMYASDENSNIINILSYKKVEKK